MKKKIVISLFIFTILIGLLSLAFNIYFLATRPLAPSGIFNLVKSSIVELKAETDNIGTSYGSAVIVSDDGTIITNAHVITYTQLGESYVFDNIYIRFIDEEDFRKVNIVKYDLEIDIAIIKIDCNKKLSPVNFGDSNKLNYGDLVYAIGNLSNHGISITRGIVSIPLINVTYEDKNRRVIQCDLTISDGNSGGALVDEHGRLIGLTTFRLKDKSNNVVYGISYSIPAGTIMEYIKN